MGNTMLLGKEGSTPSYIPYPTINPLNRNGYHGFVNIFVNKILDEYKGKNNDTGNTEGTYLDKNNLQKSKLIDNILPQYGYIEGSDEYKVAIDKINYKITIEEMNLGRPLTMGEIEKIVIRVASLRLKFN